MNIYNIFSTEPEYGLIDKQVLLVHKDYFTEDQIRLMVIESANWVGLDFKKLTDWWCKKEDIEKIANYLVENFEFAKVNSTPIDICSIAEDVNYCNKNKA